MKSRAFIFSDDQYGFYDFAVFGRAVLWFVLCYSHDRFIKIHVLQKQFEYIKGVITSGNSKKDKQHNDQKKKKNKQTLHREQKIEPDEPH